VYRAILCSIHMQIDMYISESKYGKLKSHLVINGDRYHKFHLTSHCPINNLSFKWKKETSKKVNKPQILPSLSRSTSPSTFADQVPETRLTHLSRIWCTTSLATLNTYKLMLIKQIFFFIPY